jgi:V8-like Glu-specific endopeptidase
MQRLSTVFAIAVSAAAMGCSAEATEEPVQTVNQAKVIGDNDFIVVKQDGANLPTKYRPLVNAFGIFSVGCTATHIGNGIVLTAGHCFNATATRKDDYACPANASVSWGVRADSPSYLTSKCTKVLSAQQSPDLDYAIFQVDVAPPVAVEIDAATRPALSTSVTIFSHPSLRPLEWSQTCTTMPPSDGGWGQDEFAHQCDTEPGSSGATILDDATLKVVGIHDGGIVPYNYGTYLADTPILEILANLSL